VKHGETGFVVDTIDEMVDAVDHIYQIDRRQCRQYVEDRFDMPRLADDYLRAYQQILSETCGTRRTATAAILERSIEHTAELSLVNKTPDRIATPTN